MECADAKSAFLQADNNEESRRLWTKAVPEISAAMGVKSGELLRIVGAIYGLTKCTQDFLEGCIFEIEGNRSNTKSCRSLCLAFQKTPKDMFVVALGHKLTIFFLEEISMIPSGFRFETS